MARSPSLPQTSPAYAELHCLSNFSFQRGASQPEELVQRAQRLGYGALAITDECSVAGVVRAHGEAERLGLKLLLGSEFVVALEGGALLHWWHWPTTWRAGAICANSLLVHAVPHPRGNTACVGPMCSSSLLQTANCCWVVWTHFRWRQPSP